MRIVIYGVGGVGGYFGGRLAQAGEDVIFIARGEQLRALRDHGLRVQSIKGDFTVQPVQVTDDPASIGPVDVVIVAVKTWQVPEIAPAIRPLLGKETAVVPLENGVESPDQLAAALGRDHVVPGLAKIISAISAPGEIQHSGMEPYVAFGEWDNQRSPRVERLRDAFARAGVAVEIPADIQAALWEKFLFLAAFSGVTAVTRAPAGVVRALEPTRALLSAAMHEIAAVARARGIALHATSVEAAMSAVDALPPDGTASMQRDILAGRPSELEAQAGAVVRLGTAAGVPTPINAIIYAILLPQEMAARGLAV
jgi:2-dehydropantoate 2-reductase